jgi:hypothetical protein
LSLSIGSATKLALIKNLGVAEKNRCFRGRVWHAFKHQNHPPLLVQFQQVCAPVSNTKCALKLQCRNTQQSRSPKSEHARLWRFSPSVVAGGGSAPAIGTVASLNRRGVRQPSRTTCRLRHLMCARGSVEPPSPRSSNTCSAPPLAPSNRGAPLLLAPPMLAAAAARGGAKHHAPLLPPLLPMVAGVTARGWSAGAPPSLRSWGPTGAGGVGIQKPPPPPPLSYLPSSPLPTRRRRQRILPRRRRQRILPTRIR